MPSGISDSTDFGTVIWKLEQSSKLSVVDNIARPGESRPTKKLKVDFRSVPYNHSVRPQTVCEHFVPGPFAKMPTTLKQFGIWSVCSDQTGLGFEPVWRTTHMLTINRKRFEHLLYTKLKPVYLTNQTTLECGLFGLVCPNICSLETKIGGRRMFSWNALHKYKLFSQRKLFLVI